MLVGENAAVGKYQTVSAVPFSKLSDHLVPNSISTNCVEDSKSRALSHMQ